MSILGNRVLRREDPALLTGQATYVDNIDLPGAAFVTYVRSPIAHARITELDIADARTAEGVLGVYTSADLDLDDLPGAGKHRHEMARPILARDIVRFVGEPVVAVVTAERYQGPDAAELVIVDYDPLDPVVTVDDALEAEPAFAGTESNVAVRFRAGAEDIDFSGCEVVIEVDLVNQRVAASPIEGRVGAAWWSDDGRLTLRASCQGAHPVRDELCRVYALEHDQVRVLTADVGGGFGAKASSYPETLLLPWLARAVSRPVKWSETRTENMTAMGHGRGQHQHVTLGGSRDGTVTHYRLEVKQETGAYPAMGAVLPFMTSTMLTGVYAIPNAQFSAQSILTNTTPTVAYRGAGRPEAAAAIERTIDLFAQTIGRDPAEVRRKNLIPADAFPYRTPAGTTYDCGDYPRALDLLLESAGYEDLRAQQRSRRERGERRALGIGISVYVEITALEGGSEFGSVDVQPDGKVIVRTGSSPYGQGHHTAWSMIVSERLGVPLEDIEVRHGDTDEIPHGSITGGSRSVQIAGSSVRDAAEKVVELARTRAADQLEAAIDDIVLDKVDGRFHVVGTPSIGVSWGDLAAADPLVGISDFTADGPTFPFGAHLALVEIDTETGDVDLIRHVAVDDAGTILNPLLAEGQVHGGLAQGAAQALYEEVRFDEYGNPLTANFADYSVISATELPSFETISMETPTPLNDLGAKGIGESGTIGSTPAIQNAVIDALSHLGVRHIDMPCTPERVWRAINEATKT
jgi:carbon-monoxide dehydrogenase large subunit